MLTKSANQFSSLNQKIQLQKIKGQQKIYWKIVGDTTGSNEMMGQKKNLLFFEGSGRFGDLGSNPKEWGFQDFFFFGDGLG
jgi:hypothetical protein